MGESHILGSTPDRSRYLPGTYVRLVKDYQKGKVIHAREGATGIVVQDVDGRCKRDQIAIHLMSSEPGDYLPIPKTILNLMRGEHA